MNPGEGRSSWQPRLGRRPVPPWAGLLLATVLAGCATGRANVEKNLMSDRDGSRRSAGVAEQYLVGCPDVLEVRIPDRPELSGSSHVGVTGCIELGDYPPLRVVGLTLPAVARRIAEETGQAPGAVKVRVVEFRSQYVFLSGEVFGWQRTVPYHGQETVLDLLQRIGGITLAAEPADVYVVRPHLADGRRPEIFHVDLQAIVMKQDQKTNVRLLPFDQVYVGETRQARVEKSFPPWLRPIYQAFWNMLPDAEHPPARRPETPSAWISGQ